MNEKWLEINNKYKVWFIVWVFKLVKSVYNHKQMKAREKETINQRIKKLSSKFSTWHFLLFANYLLCFKF